MSKLDQREEYPSNAYRNIQSRPLGERKDKLPEKPPEKADKPIGNGVLKKQSFIERITSGFFLGNPKEIKNRIVEDLVKPYAKSIVEAVVHMALYGDIGDIRMLGRKSDSKLGDIPYHKMYKNNGGLSSSTTPSVIRGRQPEIVMPTRQQAHDIGVALEEEISKYNRVTVKYALSLANIEGEAPMLNWGWRDITGWDVVEVRDGYLLKLPKVEELR